MEGIHKCGYLIGYLKVLPCIGYFMCLVKSKKTIGRSGISYLTGDEGISLESIKYLYHLLGYD